MGPFGTIWDTLESFSELILRSFGTLWDPFWHLLEPSGTLWDPSGPPRGPPPPIHPPTSLRNFCSTSTPVWVFFSRRSTGLQRKRCFVSARFGPERKSSFRSKTRVVNANEASRKGSARAAAGSGSGASGYVLFDPTRTLRGDLC